MDTIQLRQEWADKPSSQMRTTILQMCDDYDKAMQTIVLDKNQAKRALLGKTVSGDIKTYGTLLEKRGKEQNNE